MGGGKRGESALEREKESEGDELGRERVLTMVGEKEEKGLVGRGGCGGRRGGSHVPPPSLASAGDGEA